MSYIPVLKTCIQCEKEYYGVPTSKYCGYICAKKARESKKEVICAECGKVFVVQSYRNAKFCSTQCKHSYQSSEIVSINCSNCGISFKRKSHRVNNEHNFCCKECSNIFNSGENHYEWKSLNHIKLRKDALRKWGKKVKERDNFECQKCGENNKKILESHHIKVKEYYPDLELNIDNGVTLCIFCHSEKHTDSPKALRLINCKIKKYNEKTNSKETITS